MFLIVLGLLLWTWPHLMKEYTPGLRGRLSEQQAKPMVAVSAVLAIVLMVLGYRSADFVPLYTPVFEARHATYLLLVLAVVSFGMAKSKSHLRGWVRHPMFLGTIFWGLGHLLVRGDLASVVLFGGMILWAVAGWIVTNRRNPGHQRWTGGSVAGDLRLLAISVVVFVVIVVIHGWLGPKPFPMF